MEVWQSFKGSGVKTADTLVKSGAGFVHTITIAPGDAAPTAGTISILDSLTAGAGTALFTWSVPTTVYAPFTITLDMEFTAGLFIDFTTTDQVNNVSVSYK